jgi:hypothetical protein
MGITTSRTCGSARTPGGVRVRVEHSHQRQPSSKAIGQDRSACSRPHERRGIGAQERGHAVCSGARSARPPCFSPKQGGSERRGDARYKQTRTLEKGGSP